MRCAWFTALFTLFLTARTCTGSWSKAITSVNFSKTADALCILDAVWRNTSDGRPHQDVQVYPAAESEMPILHAQPVAQEPETRFLNSLLPDVLDRLELDRVESADNKMTAYIVVCNWAPKRSFSEICGDREDTRLLRKGSLTCVAYALVETESTCAAGHSFDRNGF